MRGHTGIASGFTPRPLIALFEISYFGTFIRRVTATFSRLRSLDANDQAFSIFRTRKTEMMEITRESEFISLSFPVAPSSLHLS